MMYITKKADQCEHTIAINLIVLMYDILLLAIIAIHALNFTF